MRGARPSPRQVASLAAERSFEENVHEPFSYRERRGDGILRSAGSRMALSLPITNHVAALELTGAIAGDEHLGDVRLVDADCRRALGIGLRPRQCRNQIIVVAISSMWLPSANLSPRIRPHSIPSAVRSVRSWCRRIR